MCSYAVVGAAIEAPVHTVQLNSYLKAGGYDLGLLINFNVPVLKNGVKRVLSSKLLPY